MSKNSPTTPKTAEQKIDRSQMADADWIAAYLEYAEQKYVPQVGMYGLIQDTHDTDDSKSEVEGTS